MDRETRDRFWSKVLRLGFELSRHADGGCWVWQGCTVNGYGRVTIAGSSVYTHRLMLSVSLGRPLRAGEHACHRCDNPSCVRPSHLFVGTAASNGADMRRKGRANPRSAKGENARSRLTLEQVREMRVERERGATLKQLSEAYGVHYSTVSLICTGHRWAGTDAEITKKPPKVTRKRAKLDEDAVRAIRRRYDAGEGIKQIAADYTSMSYAGVKNVCYRKSWRDVG